MACIFCTFVESANLTMDIQYFMKNISLFAFLLAIAFISSAKQQNNPSTYEESPIQFTELSANLMQAVIDGESTADYRAELEKVSLKTLSKQLDNDLKKKAFWINVYNAHIQIFLKENPALYDDRGAFFKTKRINIAGEMLSFDDIEHGIIRGSRSKLTLGYTKKLFVPKFERKLRCDKRDGRIHFALNCGAKSCPKVAVYHADRMDEQLDAISKQFLNTVTEIEGNTVRTTTLFSWFRGDFGGLDGVEDFLKKYQIIPQDMDPNIEFKKYDWTLYLNNYTEI